MMKTSSAPLRTGVTILALSALLTGCIISVGDGEPGWGIGDWDDREQENRQLIARLNIGDSRTEVIARLGEPDFTEGFTSEGRDYQIYYYRTHRRHSDGQTTRNETTPVVFVDDQLTGWGEKALDQVMLADE